VNEPASVRIDKWLWAVRLYKTRTEAADACRGGKVKLGGDALKPAREVRPGEILTVQAGEITRTVKVLGLLSRRVGAPLVSAYLEDLTPAEELAKPAQRRLAPIAVRPRGLGRPTKKDRRQMEAWQGEG
jgi:ribosome-associated heat shock protein Hsp15